MSYFGKISQHQQKEARDKAQAKYSDIKRLIKTEDTIERIEKFKTQYSYCEVTYMVLYEYRESNRIRSKADEKKKCSADTVKYVLKYCGYEFENSIIEQVFGSSKIRGQLSARKLRNNLTHNYKKQDIDELMLRYDDLMNSMSSFLKIINNDFTS